MTDSRIKPMKKTLVITIFKDEYYFKNLECENIDVERVLKKEFEVINRLCFNKSIRSILRHGKRVMRYFYDDWYQNLEAYKRIIIIEGNFTYMINTGLMENIHRKAPKSEKYYYTWNCIKNKKEFSKLKQLAEHNGFKCYSFDKDDCSTFGLNHNTNMYDKNTVISAAKNEYDLLFLGYLKDRKDKLLNLYQLMKPMDIKMKFVIVKQQEKSEDYSHLPFDICEQNVEYHDYLNLLSKSRALLDIVQNNQKGMGMRPMEAIFFDKKLITTNTAILKADFYNPNNILVIDVERVNEKEIVEFMKKSICPYDQQIKDYYSFAAWCERFT